MTGPIARREIPMSSDRRWLRWDWNMRQLAVQEVLDYYPDPPTPSMRREAEAIVDRVIAVAADPLIYVRQGASPAPLMPGQIRPLIKELERVEEALRQASLLERRDA